MTTKEALGRTVETQFEIAAPVEAVWKALTDAGELVRWFPLKARVTPGAGGSIWISWGPPWEGESKIEIWEPNRHLRTVWPFGAEAGEPMPVGGKLAVDYYLESRGGKTVLRLVHSGFGPGAEWDDEYEGVRTGWQFELRGLRNYLERHRGTNREVVLVRAKVKLSLDDTWKRLTGPGGLLPESALRNLREGERYSFRTAGGDFFEGNVGYFEPPRVFSGTVSNLNDAMLCIKAEKFATGMEAWAWLSTYGVAADQTEALRNRWTAQMKKLFPEGEII